MNPFFVPQNLRVDASPSYTESNEKRRSWHGLIPLLSCSHENKKYEKVAS